MKNIGDEIEFKENGIMQTRAKKVLDDAIILLEALEKESLFTALEKGIFGDVKRSKTGGKGLDGVMPKGKRYFNSFIDLMKNNNEKSDNLK
jgi:beta-lysine 5,6-aminomutase alpha subunit